MILFLYGKDTFRSRQQVKKMIAKFKQDRDPQGLNVVIVNAELEKPGMIIEQILATPFLAEKRMVVVEHLLATKHSEIQQEIQKRIEEKTLSDQTVIIFWEAIEKAKTKDAKKLFERLQQEKYAQQFDLLSGKKLEAWISVEVAERGGKIEHDAIHYLIEHVGEDMWRINTVIDQLISYCAGKTIERKDVALFVEKKEDDNIFTLVDAIVAGQQKKVFAMLQEQYRTGKDPGYILAMLIRQFRILLQLRDLYDRDELQNSTAVAKKLGLHPFVVKKSLGMVKRYPLSELRTSYEQLLDIDIKTKTGQGDQSLLIDMFVGQMVYKQV